MAKNLKTLVPLAAANKLTRAKAVDKRSVFMALVNLNSDCFVGVLQIKCSGVKTSLSNVL